MVPLFCPDFALIPIYLGTSIRLFGNLYCHTTSHILLIESFWPNHKKTKIEIKTFGPINFLVKQDFWSKKCQALKEKMEVRDWLRNRNNGKLCKGGWEGLHQTDFTLFCLLLKKHHEFKTPKIDL